MERGSTYKNKEEVVEVVKKLCTGVVNQSLDDHFVAEELVGKVLLHLEGDHAGLEIRHP